jgi:hypothetical protein
MPVSKSHIIAAADACNDLAWVGSVDGRGYVGSPMLLPLADADGAKEFRVYFTQLLPRHALTRLSRLQPNSIVNRLVGDAINTGVLTTAVSLSTLLLFDFLEGNLFFGATYFMLSKRAWFHFSFHLFVSKSLIRAAVYAVSLLATLNTRHVVRGRGTDRDQAMTGGRRTTRTLGRSVPPEVETNMFHLGTRMPSMHEPEAAYLDFDTVKHEPGYPRGACAVRPLLHSFFAARLSRRSHVHSQKPPVCRVILCLCIPIIYSISSPLCISCTPPSFKLAAKVIHVHPPHRVRPAYRTQAGNSIHSPGCVFPWGRIGNLACTYLLLSQ